MCLVIHVPHASTHIPTAIRKTFVIDDPTLASELLAITDHYVDEIVAPLATLGATIIRHDVSRLVCDPERYPDDRDECMAGIGMGAVYTMTSEGRRLRPAGWTSADRDRIMQAHYWPHARAMESAVGATLALHGRCIILDAHSFPKSPTPFENADLARPAICLGHNDHHVPEPWLATWERHARARGFDVALNAPFAGAYVPLPYLDDPRVQSLMVEFRRDLYMDEPTGARDDEGLEGVSELTLTCCKSGLSYFQGTL